MKFNVALFLLILCLNNLPATAQEEKVEIVIVDSGQAEFRRQAKLDTPDYRTAYRMLKNQVRIKPGDPELYYFLGYAIDRMQAFDASYMLAVNKAATIEASEAFETVIRLQPAYTGKLIVLDPYAKLTAVWGALAGAYLGRGNMDSARWALREGKRRGGFAEPFLSFARTQLNECSRDAVMVMSGDAVTFPTWYVQLVENFRSDVLAVDANLLGTGWYPRYLKNYRDAPISFSDATLDSMQYCAWSAATVTIPSLAPGTSSITWQLKPSYLQDYLLKGDRVLLDILQQNAMRRDIYFPLSADSTMNLSLDSFLLQTGLLKKLSPHPHQEAAAAKKLCKKNCSGFSIDQLDQQLIVNSPDITFLLNGYRWAYLYAFTGLFEKETLERELLKKEVRDKFPPSTLPYPNETFRDYFEQLLNSEK